MNYRDWPTEVGGNKFSLAKLDPEMPPAEMRVVTWSNVFESGGSVALEGYREDETRIGVTFAKIPVKGGSVTDEREHLQDLLNDFMTDLPGNWRTLIQNARTSCAEFYEKQAAEYMELSENAKNGVFK